MCVLKYGMFASELLTLLGLWIIFNLFFNYLRAMFVGPGHAPQSLDGDRTSLLVHDPEVELGRQHRFCKRCNCVKPMRAHHCSICKKCVLKMDHHCPWVNNCVGFKNFRHFFFVSFLSMGWVRIFYHFELSRGNEGDFWWAEFLLFFIGISVMLFCFYCNHLFSCLELLFVVE